MPPQRKAGSLRPVGVFVTGSTPCEMKGSAELPGAAGEEPRGPGQMARPTGVGVEQDAAQLVVRNPVRSGPCVALQMHRRGLPRVSWRHHGMDSRELVLGDLWRSLPLDAPENARGPWPARWPWWLRWPRPLRIGSKLRPSRQGGTSCSTLRWLPGHWACSAR